MGAAQYSFRACGVGHLTELWTETKDRSWSESWVNGRGLHSLLSADAMDVIYHEKVSPVSKLSQVTPYIFVTCFCSIQIANGAALRSALSEQSFTARLAPGIKLRV